MDNKRFLNISAILIYILLIVLYINYFTQTLNCGYDSPCIRFCDSDTSKYNNSELMKAFRKSRLSPYYYDSSKDERNIYRGAPDCGKMKYIPTKTSRSYYEDDSYYFGMSGKVYVGDETYNSDRYCLEKSDDSWKLMVCEDDRGFYRIFHVISIILSTGFLLFTLIVYAYFSELRNFHGKCFISFIASQIGIYALIPFFHLDRHSRDRLFMFISAIVILLCFISTLIWLTSMVVSTFLTFRNFKEHNESARYDFSTYVKFAAFSVAYSIFVLASDLIFRGYSKNYLLSTYFFIIIVDVVLIIKTGITIYRVSKNLEESEHGYFDNERKWYWIYVKLFAIIFVTWPFEVFTWTQDFNRFGYFVSDFMKLLSAVAIFGILIGRKSVQILLLKKYRGIEDIGSQNYE